MHLTDTYPGVDERLDGWKGSGYKICTNSYNMQGWAPPFRRPRHRLPPGVNINHRLRPGPRR